MLALGVLACPLMAAAARLAISERWKRWLVGLPAGLWVAVTPYISRIRNLDAETELLEHSMLLAAIGLTALVLLALLAALPDQRQQAHNLDSTRFGKTGHSLPAIRDKTTATAPLDNDCLPPLPAEGLGFPPIHIAAEPVLDLTATERLYTNSRQPSVELTLPENRDWLAQGETDAATDKAMTAEPAASLQSQPETISEAEFTEQGNDPDNTLEFGDHLTGEYSHPALANSPPDDTATWITPGTTETPLPTTLEAALENARSAATTMASQVTELQHGVAELTGIHHAGAVEQCSDQLAQAHTLHHRQALYAASSETYVAAEAVIAVQRKLLEEATAQRKLIAQKWRLEHARVGVHKQEVDRLREMARDAAQLARRAALAQQNIRDIFIREQTARLKSEKSARRAVRIARNAITALTTEERKNRIPET